MAHLNRQQYDYRRESAARRAEDNKQLAQQSGMTEREAELVAELARLRHELHTSIGSYIQSGTDMEQQLIAIKTEINGTALPRLDYGRYDQGDYIDIDNIDLLYETDEVPDDDTERGEWLTDNHDRIYADWESLNRIIERYLESVDKQYGTTFAPTGQLRIF